MKDRAVSILDNYEFQILRTWKGRGAILCETNQGIKILKEYNGAKDKIRMQYNILLKVKENGYTNIEEIILNKEGEPFCVDMDSVTYIVKNYFEGRECNIKDEKECFTAVRKLALLHNAMTLPEIAAEMTLTELPIVYEFDKRNKELRKVRRYLKEKSQKTDFELFLLKNYDFFYNRAIETTEELKKYPLDKWMHQLLKSGTFSHGDYQYHNILFHGDTVNIVNFEKYALDDPIRDLYLFTRKLLEKNGWDIELGKELINEYSKERELTIEDRIQFIYRFLYPEKFWKIVNYYYNSTKSWIPLRNREKLEKIINQEEVKDLFVETVLRNI